MAAPRDAADAALARNAANHVALTPVSFLEHSAVAWPTRVAVRHGPQSFTYAAFAARCRRLASALRQAGVERGDTVAIVAPNVPAMLEAHYAVPALGAILNALNYRLDARTIAFCLDHGGAKVVLVDAEFAPLVREALSRCECRPLVVDLDDAEGPRDASLRIGTQTYDELLATGDPAFEWPGPLDEWDSLSLLYTSGTTGDPKGVLYHHRGAYLNALGNALAFRLTPASVYLWTLPMFHCNGWTYTWAVTAAGGTHVCLRKVDPGADLRGDRDASRHAPVRRADRAEPARPCARGRAARVRPCRRGRDRRRRAALRDHRRHGGARLSRDASVRPHRNVRARDVLRVAGRMGRAAAGRARAC